jgi:coenzyme PQQ precursor peptide PqqA
MCADGDWAIIQSRDHDIAFNPTGDKTMWTKPAASDLRFGFEVTMYIAAR